MEFNSTIGIIIVVIIGLLAAYFMFSKGTSVSSDPVSKATTVLQSTPTASIAAPVQVVAKKVSLLDQFDLINNMDHPGDDIGCFDGKGGEFCAEKCLADPTCKSIINVDPANGAKWLGCCYKRSTGPLNPLTGGSFYIRK